MAAPNWINETMWTGDNLPIMRGMNSASVDLIYLDPPFNSNHDYAAPIGSQAAGAEFKDTWSLRDIDVAWLDLIEQKHPKVNRVIHSATMNSDKSYLIYMAARLIEMCRILKPTGSIYLHCDPTMSHYLKLLMDAIFGRKNFLSEVIWKRTSSHNRAKRWGPIHDTILYYGSSREFTWNRVLQPLDRDYVEQHYNKRDTRGIYQIDNLTGPGIRDGDTGQPWRNVDPTDTGRHWELPPDRALPDWFVIPDGYSDLTARQRLDVLDGQGLVHWPQKQGGKPRFKRYLNSRSGQPLQDVITDIKPLSKGSPEYVDYPTQKPIALLKRIIQASSNDNDIVLDPFCGCATASVAAHEMDRKWVGIDISPKAFDLVKRRIIDRGGLFYNLTQRTDVPQRTDLGVIPKYNSTTNRNQLYGEQGGFCAGCGTHFQPQHLTVDHIIARSSGGTDHIDNLQLLCGNCNSIKGNRGMEYLMTRLAG